MNEVLQVRLEMTPLDASAVIELQVDHSLVKNPSTVPGQDA